MKSSVFYSSFSSFKANTLIPSFQKSKYSLFASYIYYFKLVDRIHYLFLIHRAIVIDLNFIILPIFLTTTFSRYPKLSQDSISLQLVACCLIKVVQKDIILFSLFKSTLYDTEKPKWLRKIMASVLAQAK